MQLYTSVYGILVALNKVMLKLKSSFFFLFLFLGIEVSASQKTLVHTLNTISFVHQGTKYQIKPQRIHATCQNQMCSFKVMGQTLTLARSQFITLSSGSSVKASSSSEAQAPCTNCQRSGTLAQFSSNLSSSSFVTPVNGTLTSLYGEKRKNRYSKKVRIHRGIDIAAPKNTTVRASRAGRIVEVVSNCGSKKSCGGGYGNYITIDHGNGIKTRYAHLSNSCPLPRKGTIVGQNEKIGCVGSTGRSTGNHLHFEIIINNRTVDPLDYIRGN